MDIKGIDNLYSIIGIIVVFSILYFTFMSYTKEATERFVVPAPAPAPATAPAILEKKSQPIMIPRQVSPSGPSAPNARVSDVVARQSDNYNVIPNDPQDEQYGSQDIKDNMRYVERSFGPGIANTGNKLLVNSEVANERMLGTTQPLQPFSPEFVSNGGMMGSIAANDTTTEQNFASF